jgi:hypothetical protein
MQQFAGAGWKGVFHDVGPGGTDTHLPGPGPGFANVRVDAAPTRARPCGICEELAAGIDERQGGTPAMRIWAYVSIAKVEMELGKGYCDRYSQ